MEKRIFRNGKRVLSLLLIMVVTMVPIEAKTAKIKKG